MTLSLGSCFSAEMGRRMAEAGMEVCVNPFGVLYNPASVASSLLRLAVGRLVAAAAGGRTALRTGGRRPAGHQSGAGGTAAESRVAGAPSHCP